MSLVVRTESSIPESKLCSSMLEQIRFKDLFPACYYESNKKLLLQHLGLVSAIEASFAEPKLCFQPFITTGVGNFISNLFLQHKFKVLFPRSKFLSAIKTLSQPAVTTQIWSLFSRIKASFPKSKIFGGSKASYYKWNLKLRFQDQCFVFRIVALFPTYHQNSNLKFRFHDIWNKKALFPK